MTYQVYVSVQLVVYNIKLNIGPGVFGSMLKTDRKFYSGTSGMVLPVPNKMGFPPEFQGKSRLSYYGYLFNSIEINSSFYKVPMASTVARWAGEVPEHFRFTFKMWRDITHVKGLTFKAEDVYSFIQVINSVCDKKGCLLVQFPPGLKLETIYQVERLLLTIRKADPQHEWKLFLEFRKSHWYREEVHELLKTHSANMVLHDKTGSQTDFTEQDSDNVYLRFHGPGGNYRGSYTDDFLYEYSHYINDWLGEDKSVFVYFNNTMGDAVQNLMTLNRFVGEF